MNYLSTLFFLLIVSGALTWQSNENIAFASLGGEVDNVLHFDSQESDGDDDEDDDSAPDSYPIPDEEPEPEGDEDE